MLMTVLVSIASKRMSENSQMYFDFQIIKIFLIKIIMHSYVLKEIHEDNFIRKHSYVVAITKLLYKCSTLN